MFIDHFIQIHIKTYKTLNYNNITKNHNQNHFNFRLTLFDMSPW